MDSHNSANPPPTPGRTLAPAQDAEALLNSGIAENKLKHYPQSLRLLNAAYPLLEEQKANNQQAYCAYYIGLNLKAIGEFDQAHAQLMLAMELAKALRTAEGAALEKYIHLYLGICKEALEAYDSATEHLQIAASQFETPITEKNSTHYLRASLHLHGCAMRNGNPALAESRLLMLGSQRPDVYQKPELKALYYYLLGISQALNAHFTTAVTMLEKAQVCYKALPDSTKELATIAQYLGVVYLSLDKPEKSFSQLVPAKRYFDAVQDIESIYFLNIALTLYYHTKNDIQGAKNHLEAMFETLGTSSEYSPKTIAALCGTTGYFIDHLKALTTDPGLAILINAIIKKAASLLPPVSPTQPATRSPVSAYGSRLSFPFSPKSASTFNDEEKHESPTPPESKSTFPRQSK